MSRVTRCNRCAAEVITDPPVRTFGQAPDLRSSLLEFGRALSGWRSVNMMGWPMAENVQPAAETFDLCEDCVEVFLLQFMKGARIEAITQPADQTDLPHQPQLDCLLAFDPERGGFICEHDDPERYGQLVVEAQESRAISEQVDTSGWVKCPTCQCTAANSPGCACHCHLQYRAAELVSDVTTAGAAHAFPQRLISTDGEDLTEAYSDQEPFTDE